ncbi:MAG: hypothetical protein QNK37_20795 [Acidobacteriota bacterium]|nr:hypothetical protein [Acidobacteriota bacterium]
MNGNRRGHILLLAIIMVTLLTITFAMTMQPALTQTQRMREKETIYRGKHLADGLRRFYFKYGRFPFELDELIEQEPRFVRRVYECPVSPDGEWTLVYLMPEDRGRVTNLKGIPVPGRSLPGDSRREANSETEKEGPGLTRSIDSTFRIKNRQITGVRPKSDMEGLHVLEESRIYSDWLFSALPKREVNMDDLIEAGKPPEDKDKP